MAPTVDTLLELYDQREPITNVTGAWHLHPKTIVFFYYDLADPKEERKELAQMFNRIGLRCNVRMERLERLDVNHMMAWVQAHRDDLGEYAIELTGGNDVMLFSAGVAYGKTPCRLYTRTRDGRYIALPSGEEVKASGGSFTVAQRLLLNNATLDRFGRLTPADLKAPLVDMAHRLLGIQKKHPRQWTQHTTCFQQCASRAEDHAVTILLDNANCREHGVSLGKGKLLTTLLKEGALTKAEACDEGIWVTFASEQIKDCLCDFGVWLEIAAWDALRSCGAFDDVQLSCVVKWDNEKIINELDVVATTGMGLMIVSCKTCAPDLKAVAELNVLGDRLGSAHTQTVLLCMPKANEKLDNIRARCDEMGVHLVDLRQFDREGLRGHFAWEGKTLRTGRK
ncbi:MAG: DUF1887 family protein [Clostridia bacterium]|nr:DUF1887 family protein [Clostridia bacterium]